MELHQLRYFCAVADTGSFSRAAEKCHVSQPSLSQQILKLESELGGRLFDRLGRSVRLTDLGEAFLPRARSVLHELSSAKDELTERLQSEAGPVVIGAIPTIAPYWLASPRHLLPQISQGPSHHRRRDHAGSSRTPPRRFRGPCRSGPSDPRPRIRYPPAFHRAPLCRVAENSQARPAPHVATRRSSPRSISFSSRRPLLSRYRRRRLRSRPPRSPRRLRKRPPFQSPCHGRRRHGRLPRPRNGRGQIQALPLRPHRGHPSRTHHRRRSATRPHPKPRQPCAPGPPRLTPKPNL